MSITDTGRLVEAYLIFCLTAFIGFCVIFLLVTKGGNMTEIKAIISNGVKELVGAVYRMPRFAPSLIALASLPLLCIRDLGQQWYRLIVPALVVYAIGAALLGMLHRMIALSSEKRIPIRDNDELEETTEEFRYFYPNNEMTIHLLGRICLYLAHMGWFALLICYLIRVWIIRF